MINKCVNILGYEVVGLENFVHCKYIPYPSLLIFCDVSVNILLMIF